MNPQQLLAHAARLRANLSTGQLASLIAAFVAVVAVVVGSAYWANTPNYTVLYRDLDPESANAVVTRLKTANTPYQLVDNGTTLLVPATRVDELRLDLASQGLPTAGRAGFELLDKTTFGTTEFMESVNYRRALEGELARTIATIDDVGSARVHLAMATTHLYASDSTPAKASVVLKLKNSRPLSPQTVAGITGLVASAFGRRWTAPKDLPNALERLSEVAIMKSAGKDTARVADELFAFSRTIADNRDLRAALTDPGRSVADRAGLVETLLKGKAHKATITLAKQSLAGGYRDPSSALAEYQLVAAQVQGQGVATVRVARPLADDHAARLAAALQARAGHPVHLNVIVDPEVLGGISVAIGDDVIDGTVSTRLAAAGRQLAG